jgi:hypothetical protein
VCLPELRCGWETSDHGVEGLMSDQSRVILFELWLQALGMVVGCSV